MIHIFGDSHANYNFKNLKYFNINHYENSITMHRVGRDKLNYINFKNKGIIDNDIIIYQFGEVDCRTHIGKQLILNRYLNEIVSTLVENYIESILENKRNYNNINIIVCCVPPPICKEYHENINGPVTHHYPFVGTNMERAYYTLLINMKLKQKCLEHNFIFFDYYSYYSNNHNLLKVELSDNVCHIKNNEKLLELVESCFSLL